MIDEKEFAPAVLLQHEDGEFDLSLTEFSAGYELVDQRKLQGGGYTWQALVKYLVRSRAPEFESVIRYDSEGDTFVALSPSLDAIRAVGKLVQSAVTDPQLLREAFDNADRKELE